MVMAMKRGFSTIVGASLLGVAHGASNDHERGEGLPQCVPGLAPPGVQIRVSESYYRMVERTCHWNCYTVGVDFYPPAPPEFWRNGTYTVAECTAWCDTLPGCTGFEYPTGCSGTACDAYPDKAILGSYCGLLFRGMCQSSTSPGYHVSPGFDTYIRSAPALPRNPYYAYSEHLQPTSAPLTGGAEVPPKVADLLSQGHGFAQAEKLLEMQLAMDYPIFFNNSALLPDFPLYSARVDESLRQSAWDSVSNLTDLFGRRVENTFAGWTVAAALLIMLELYDPAHEILLGNQQLLPSSEVWDWLHTFQKYPHSYWLYRPMSPENHYLHAILHRIEGHRVGEAGLTGYDNAKFWFGGGVEKPSWGLGMHPVYASLADAASSHEPLRRCCIRAEPHTVAVPPGRPVHVAAGWDPFAFIDFHRAVVEGPRPQAEDIAALRWAQRYEFELLFNYSITLAMDANSDRFLSGVHLMVPVILQGNKYQLWAQRWGGGPVKILIVHGGPGCSHTVLDSLTEILSPLDYELIYFDQLGGGRSDCADPSSSCHATMPSSLNDFVDQIEQVREYMGLPTESTVLFGHSWGVMLAIEHALRYPGAVKGYILGGFPASLAAQMRRMRALSEMNVSDFFGSFICRAKPCPPSFVWGAAHCNHDLNRHLLWTDGGMSCTGVLCDWNRTGALKNITAPTLLVVGDYDIAAPVDVRDMATAMPQGVFVQFRNCGHAEWIDASAAFAETLSTWVRRIFESTDRVAQMPLNDSGHPLDFITLNHVIWLSAAGCLASLYSIYFAFSSRSGKEARTFTTGRGPPLLAP